jgi:hypothetical protein
VYESEGGERYLLVIHEALFFGDDMTESLINPNQLRANGIVVDDCPRQFSIYSTHSIYDPMTKVTIPLDISGIMSGFNTFMPTQDELDNLPWIVLTENAKWDPHSLLWAHRHLNIKALQINPGQMPSDLSASNRARTLKAIITCQQSRCFDGAEFRSYTHGVFV